MKLTFLGATGTVTGSKYLLEVRDKKILVDCGLFQGIKTLRRRNWTPLPFNPEKLDAVLLTHAHIDHSGYLPLLVKKGFKGPIYCTEATADLCEILLPDSGYLQEEEAHRANLYGYSRHHPALPLYTEEDARLALNQLHPVDYNTAYKLLENGEVSWHEAGHILGSASIYIKHIGIKTIFSGDVGRLCDPLMQPKASLPDTDYLILESTYGDRLHEDTSPELALKDIIMKTIHRGGSLLIPAFAVGRAQHILYCLHQLKLKQEIPDLPIFLDSPMSVSATKLLLKYQKEHKLDAQMSLDICRTATYINSPEDSMALCDSPEQKIIISASGMLTGGRVLHHLKAMAPNPKHTILLTGFQAPGTRGEKLLSQSPTIKIHGELVPIQAEVAVLHNLSAHADYSELLDWLKSLTHAPKAIFLTHGSPEAAAGLKQRIESKFHWPCIIPKYKSRVDLK